MKIADLHVHTVYSNDGKSTMEEYCLAALQKHVGIVCFTDHIECDEHSPYYTLGNFDFAGQRNEFEKLRDLYAPKGLKLLLGYELGEPHRYPKVLEFLLSKQPDYILGSVHCAYDRYHHEKDLTPEELWEQHYAETLKLARFGGVDVLAHLDFPKKKAVPFLKNKTMQHEILQACVKNGIALEVNTSALPAAAETAPSLTAVREYLSLGGSRVTVSSDAHEAAKLGYAVAETREALPPEAIVGYFEGRKFFAL